MKTFKQFIEAKKKHLKLDLDADGEPVKVGDKESPKKKGAGLKLALDDEGEPVEVGANENVNENSDFFDLYDKLKDMEIGKVNDLNSGEWQLNPIDDIGISARQEPTDEEWQKMTSGKPRKM